MGANSTKEVVKETVADIQAQQELIDEINKLFEKLRSRFDEDYAKISDATVIFKHESFQFKYTSVDDVAGIVDTVSNGLNALKPKSKDVESLDQSSVSNKELQGIVDGGIGVALDQLTDLFAMIAPQLGNRTGTSYEWSTDMRLISSNMFLYNAAFVYKFDNKGWFKSTEVVAIGYFSYIFQSQSFVSNFEELKKSLTRLEEFDHKKEALYALEAKCEEMLNEALEGDGDTSKYDKFQAIADKKRKELLGTD